jgi:MoaA/NifB/PqqE/SkfB family radical SAM enzyme
LTLHINREILPVLPEQSFLPDAYRLPEGNGRGAIATLQPRVVFIEITNRCNLLCQTCPRTFFDREPLRSLTLKEFINIAEQFPHMQRALLHGIGDMLASAVPIYYPN